MMLQDDDHPAHKAIALVLTMGLISFTLEEIGTYEKKRGRNSDLKQMEGRTFLNQKGYVPWFDTSHSLTAFTTYRIDSLYRIILN